ncbi:hypothetical protein HD806DRAFT_543611 [Xylariaceae sp. AK1471]|nr:hypothetical protein HD806DRAFT_543611 [Xylariaceae sp. AK1471]
MKGNSQMWYQGDRIPRACDPCKDDREEREYDLALSDSNRCFGKGIEEDPLVVWINGPDYLDRDLIWAHNNFAKAIAKVLGFTHTWIIKAAHNKQYARDAEGKKIPIAPGRYLVHPADMHITLRLGTDLYDCRLSAHAYVLLDRYGNPDKYMTQLARKFKKEGGDSQLEFWPWRNNHKRFLPQRPISLGPNWEVYANVGPYIDTYRPDNRRTGDTYTPRSDSTPPREDVENEYGIIEGAMTPEMVGMMRQCHAAYYAYVTFHQELIAMDYPPPDRVRELHAMHEQIVTMNREIYREVKGVLE